ncbi:transposase [Nocardia nepalensis]|uniref:transposase n=1 Tax=Nocardia nepalensis TaxID=3375448 RepID=UPI003B6832E5
MGSAWQLPWPAWLDGAGGRPEEFCRREILDGIFYLADKGCNVPADLPPWHAVYDAFARWWNSGDLDAIHTNLRKQLRRDEGRESEPTAAGRKRYVIVDTLGLLLVVLVTGANTQDRDAAGPALIRLRAMFDTISLGWAEGAYAVTLVRWAKTVLALRFQIVKRADSATGFEVILAGGWSNVRWRGSADADAVSATTKGLPEHHEAMVRSFMLMSHRLARQRK